MGNRRKVVYLTAHGLENAFIVLAGFIPSPLPPEPEREIVQITGVKTRKYLQPRSTSSLQCYFRQAGILEVPLSITRKMLSRDQHILFKPSLFSSYSEWCWTSTPTPTECSLHLQPITMPDYLYNKSLSSNIKLSKDWKPIFLLLPMWYFIFLYLPTEMALIRPSTVPIKLRGASVLMQTGELRSLETQRDP